MWKLLVWNSCQSERSNFCVMLLYIIDFIEYHYRCQNPSGGFGGGPGQISHLAPTYAAVNALIILGTEEAYKVINRFVHYLSVNVNIIENYFREKLHQFLWSLKQQNGSFCMHVDGEIDIRGVYCALSVGSLTNVLSDKLCENTAEWIIR